MPIPNNNANDEELTSEENAIVARWADRVCLYAEDLYDQEDEALLRQILQKTDDLEKLAPALKEKFLNQLKEEDACAQPERDPVISPSPLVGLLRDYSEARPIEKALINFVLRRLTNLTVPKLVSAARRRSKLGERIQMNNIPEKIRATLKRLCPYVGPNIPESVRKKTRELWKHWRGTIDLDECAGWQWDAESGFYQCELELCDLDDWTIDPKGYVAIRPLKQGKFALVFDSLLSSADEIDPSKLIFPTVEEAKRYLDRLLAADTPLIPVEPPERILKDFRNGK
jgi:hypothetical protein